MGCKLDFLIHFVHHILYHFCLYIRWHGVPFPHILNSLPFCLPPYNLVLYTFIFSKHLKHLAVSTLSLVRNQSQPKCTRSCFSSFLGVASLNTIVVVRLPLLLTLIDFTCILLLSLCCKSAILFKATCTSSGVAVASIFTTINVLSVFSTVSPLRCVLYLLLAIPFYLLHLPPRLLDNLFLTLDY